VELNRRRRIRYAVRHRIPWAFSADRKAFRDDWLRRPAVPGSRGMRALLWAMRKAREVHST